MFLVSTKSHQIWNFVDKIYEEEEPEYDEDEWTTHYPKGIVASEKELSSPDSGRRNPTYDR